MALLVSTGNLDRRSAGVADVGGLTRKLGGITGAGEDAARCDGADAGDLRQLGAAGGEFGLDAGSQVVDLKPDPSQV